MPCLRAATQLRKLVAVALHHVDGKSATRFFNALREEPSHLPRHLRVAFNRNDLHCTDAISALARLLAAAVRTGVQGPQGQGGKTLGLVDLQIGRLSVPTARAAAKAGTAEREIADMAEWLAQVLATPGLTNMLL